MEYSIQSAELLPGTVDSVEECESLSTKELWIRARTFSRLRHRASPRREPEKRREYEALKLHYLRHATLREPNIFLIFIDPGFPHLVLVYHRFERNLLHVPLEVWNEGV